MLTYNLANIGNDSLYEYLYKCIKNDIIQGILPAGEKLPSKRAFAKNLGISVITVENAYSMLAAEGYVYSLPKKGFFIANLKACMPVTNNVNHYRETVQKDDLQSDHIKEQEPYLADFSSNQTESSIFPFSIWTKTMRNVMADHREKLLINPPCGGLMELRKNIARYLMEFRGMYVQPEQIIIGAGTEYLHGLLIQLLGAHTKYGVENPGYLKIAKIYDSMHVSCDHIDMDSQGVLVEKLEEKKIDVIHISPSHHFPTGKVMPISRRYELLGWASKGEHRYIIEDDYDSELRLIGRPIPTLQSIDVADKVIYMNTFTKTLCSTVRISYMVLPTPLTERFYKELSFYSGTVSNFEQYTLSDFLESGAFEKHINRLRNYYQNKRDAILSVLQTSPLGEYLTITEEEAGVHFLMSVATERSEDEIVKRAEEKGIRLVPLSRYYIGEMQESPNTYVMNYSSIPESNFQKIATALLQIITT